MEEITKVTETDIGRIAVDEESLYRVKILGLSEEEGYVSVEYLPGSNYDEGRLVGKISSSFNLAIAQPGRTMYWEDSLKQKVKTTEPVSLHSFWFRVKETLDKVGEDEVNKVLSELYKATQDLNYGLNYETYLKSWPHEQEDERQIIGIDESGKFNGWYSAVAEEQGHEILSFDDFKVRAQLLIDSQNKKEKEVKVAKPRFHKKRQKPPVRQKTDIVIQYKTGQTYTLKNINSVSVNEGVIRVNTMNEVEKGINTEVYNEIKIDLVYKITIKAPKFEIEIHNYGDNEFLIYFEDGYSLARRWFKTF